jgi:hypothetical protein
MSIRTVVVVSIGLAAANFIYAAVTGQKWDVALDRSAFQAMALIVARVLGEQQ